MEFKYLYIFILFSIIILSSNSIYASEFNDNNTMLSNPISDDGLDINEGCSVSLNNDEIILIENSGDFNQSDNNVIYVGQNISENGNGSYENPFSNLELACNNVSEGKENLTIKIFDGKYYLNKELKFNVSNLNIIGIGNNVSINSIANTNLQAISFVSSSANFTFKNILFNLSNQPSQSWKFLQFYIINGNVNCGTFDNCTFVGGKKTYIRGGSEFNSQFVNCKFKGFTVQLFKGELMGSYSTSFKYCIFDVNFDHFATIKLPKNISIEDSWFGENSLPGYIGPFISNYVVNPDSTYNHTYSIPINRYAQMLKEHFIINYLGNNQYEIIGKLTWNGTEDQEGMENFQPMALTLKSDTGDINQTATLVNGNFRVIYTSFNPIHKVTATLHNEEIELEFTTVNITADPVSVYYGEDQNITFNFTQPITANVTVTVSNGSYNKTEKVEVVGKDSITYTIPDTLKAGIYDIEISLAENNLYGSNTTTFTVSKVSDYTFNIDIQDNGNLKADDNLVITVELPKDASGNITVKVNDNPEITKEATQNTMITISSLVGGDNNITISYSGNDKYASIISEPQVVTAQKASVPGGENILNMTTPANSATPTYSINLPNATGNLTVIVDGKDKYTKTLENGSATITVPELSAGKHDITVTYTGDAKYESISKNTTVNVPDKISPAKKPVVKKAATKITAKKKTFKAKKKVKKYTITLKSGKKPVKKVWVTLKIKGKKLLKAKTNAKGKATFKIKKLTKKGKYKAVIKFKGNKNYKACSKKVKITIKK